MTLRQLQCFMVMAKVLNFSKASDMLYITQPGLSYTIRTLEAELGVNLFKKDGKKTVLTPEGITFYHYVKIGLENIEQGINEIKGAGESGIKIGYLYSTPIDIVNALVERFCGESGINVSDFKQYIFESNEVALQALEDGKVDIAFCIHAPAHMDMTTVFHQHIYLVASKNSPLADKDSIGFYDIKNIPCVIPSNGVSLRHIIHQIYQHHNAEPQIVEAPSITVAISYAMTENCYTIIPTLPAADFSKLKVLNLEGYDLKRPIFMVTEKKHIMSDVGKKFHAFMKKAAEQNAANLII